MSSTGTQVDTIKALEMIDCDFGKKMSSSKIAFCQETVISLLFFNAVSEHNF